MNFVSEDIEILKILLEKDSLGIYSLHEKFQLSAGQVVVAIKKLLDLGVIKYDSDAGVLSRAENFHQWIVTNRKAVFLSDRDRHWRQVPEGILADTERSEIISKVLNKDIKNFRERAVKGLANRGGFAS